MVKDDCCESRPCGGSPKSWGRAPEEQFIRVEIRVTFPKDPGTSVLSRRTQLTILVLLGGFIGSAWLAEQYLLGLFIRPTGLYYNIRS